MRQRREKYEAAHRRRRVQGAAAPVAVERTGQLYRIPRVREEGVSATSVQWSAECVTWPRYQGVFKLSNDTGASMLDLTKEEAEALQIVLSQTKVRKEEYGAAHHFNWKKTGVSVAYFKRTLVHEGSMPTPRAAAAFRYLMQENKFYALYSGMQRRLLEEKEELRITSYDLFIVHKGIECAMYPVLYPTTEFSDTGIMTQYRDETSDATNRVTSIGFSWTRKVYGLVN